MSRGWVKLWRKTQDSDMYKSLNSKQRDVMMNILMLANHKERTWEWQGELQTCKPGQFKTSLSSLQEVCADDVSIQNIRTAIKKLKQWDFLTNKSTKSGRVITVVNWGKYQENGDEGNKEDNKEVTKSQQRGNKEVTTNKNNKELKNGKNGKKSNNGEQSSPPYQKIINYLNKKTNRNFKLSIEETREKIEVRFDEGFGLEDFKNVIDTKVADWKDDNEMQKYLRPGTLFSDKFEGYLNEEKPDDDKQGGSGVTWEN